MHSLLRLLRQAEQDLSSQLLESHITSLLELLSRQVSTTSSPAERRYGDASQTHPEGGDDEAWLFLFQH